MVPVHCKWCDRMDDRVVWGPREKDLTGVVHGWLEKTIFLELIKRGIESWLYYFCDTDLNSLNLSYLALMSFTMLLWQGSEINAYGRALGYIGRQCCSGTWIILLDSLGLDFNHLRNEEKVLVRSHPRAAIRPKKNNGYRVGWIQLPHLPPRAQ